MTSLRLAQPIFGLGLLDAVPEETLRALVRQQKEQGLNGRVNTVWDASNRRPALGRYGWKANQPSLKQQVAAAAIGDLGVSSNLYPDQNCPPIQDICRRELPGNVPEIINHELDALELWLRGLAVPARRNTSDAQVRRGEIVFGEARCGACHLPEMKTARAFPPLPQLANQTFHAYTDLLLHDMGEQLADGRPDFEAGPRDWRTPPLWGLGLSATVNGSTALLHDGRARNAIEAAGHKHETITVPGALELPAAISLAAKSGRFCAFVALGVVIRGETYHFEIVSEESARALMDLTLDGFAIGNGVLTVENEEQAIARADPREGDKGGHAARAALSLFELREKYGA